MVAFGDIGNLKLLSTSNGLGSVQKLDNGLVLSSEQVAALKKGIAEFKSGNLSLPNMLSNYETQNSEIVDTSISFTPEKIEKLKKMITDFRSGKLSWSDMLQNNSKQDLIEVDSALGKKLQAHFESRDNKPVNWMQKNELDGYVPVYETVDNSSPWPSKKLVGYRPKTEQENKGIFDYNF